MACIRKLKEDIAKLESLFPRGHSVLQVMHASVDEITLKFADPTGHNVVINGNIQENYPRQPPIWFAEQDDVPAIGQALERLSEATTGNTNILVQVYKLCSDLCTVYGMTPPPELSQIAPMESPMERGDDVDEGQGSEMEETDEEEMEMGAGDSNTHAAGSAIDDDGELESDGDDNEVVEMADEEPVDQMDEGVSREGLALLEKVSRNNRQQHLEGKVSGSVTATDRLMKEMREIYKSQHFKNGVYSFSLGDDETNLYEWWIKIHKVDEDSQLYLDMKQLKEERQQDHLLFHFVFNENFPFEPPFVRVAAPTMVNGFVLSGGAICMEVLTKQGWSSAYSIEALIFQISASMVKGKARILFDKSKESNSYSLQRAQQSYRSLVQIHKKSGWYTPPKNDG